MFKNPSFLDLIKKRMLTLAMFTKQRGNWASPIKYTPEGLIKKCCICEKVNVKPDSWRKAIITRPKKVTHGYCPPCSKKVMKEYEQKLKYLNRAKAHNQNGGS